MALNFSGLDTQSTVDSLTAKYAALAAELAALTSSASVSDQGRSIDNGKTAESIVKQMQEIRMQLSLMAGPFFGTSRRRS
jgi:hypothetical protein